MTSWEAIKQTLRAWIIAETGLASEKVILANEAGPAPAVPYIALRTLGMPSPDDGMFVIAPHAESDSERFVYAGDGNFTVELQGFGVDSLSMLSRLHASLHRRDVLDGFVRLQRTVVTVLEAHEGETYSIRINGEPDETVECEAGWDREALRDALVTAINANEFMGDVMASDGDEGYELVVTSTGGLEVKVEVPRGTSWIESGEGSLLGIERTQEAVFLSFVEVVTAPRHGR